MASNRLRRPFAAVFFCAFIGSWWPTASWTDDGDNLWSDSGILFFDAPTFWWDAVSDGNGGALALYFPADPSPGTDYIPLVLKIIEHDGTSSELWGLGLQVRYATIISDGNGGVLIAYVEGKIDEHGYTIYAQRYSPANGFMWGGGIGLQVSTSFDPFLGFSIVNEPIIATDGIGGLYISWRDRLAYVAPDGTLAAPGLDGIRLLTIPDILRPSDFRLVADGTGGIYAAWHIYRTTGLIVQHVQNGLGLEWGPDGLLLDPGAEWILSLANDGAGGFVVGWGEGSSVYAQKYSSDGVPQWPHTGVFVATGITHSDSTRMLTDGAGGVFVTWETDAGTFMQRIAANGVVLWPTDVLISTQQYVRRPMVADGSGGVVLVAPETAFSEDIKAVRVTADGYRLYSRWVRQDGVSPAAPGLNQILPKIAFDASGPDPKGAVILWGESDGGIPTQVYGQKIEVADFDPPANDSCADAIPVTVGQYSGTLIEATNDGSVNCVADSDEPDAWYSFTSPAEGRLKVTTCGTNDRGGIDADMDTVVSLHSGCTGTGANELACNDDWPTSSLPDACTAMDQGHPYDSAVHRFMTASERLLIRVSRYGGTIGGHFSLHVDFVTDTDGDGHLDDVDNCTTIINGGQRDTDRDGFGNICDADFNDDCITNFIDLSRMAELFFTNDTSPDWDPDVDLNGDGAVNFVDLQVMKALFFAAPGPGGGPNICEAYCGLRNTGLHSGEHFGVELFVRGSFTDWDIRAPFRLSNYGDGVYRAQAQLAVPVPPEPDPHQLKIADAAWTLEYDTLDPLLLEVPLTLYGGTPDGSPDISFDLQHSGCYNFRVEVADPGLPPARVELMVNRKP